nr:IS4 family transposase [uncultured Blautia sp.]
MNSTFASSYELLLSAISELELQKDSFVLHPGVDFSRKRKISFRDTILSLLTMQGGSLSTTSHDFFQHRLPADIPSLSAIHQQRAKLLPDAMSYLFYHFTQKLPAGHTYDGFQLLACDGSDLNICYDPADKESCKPSGNGKRGSNQLHLHALYDLCNKRYTDIRIEKTMVSNESRALVQMLGNISTPARTIILADRGYETYHVFAHIMAKGLSFVIRTKDISRRGGISYGFRLPDRELDEDLDFFITRSTVHSKKDPVHYKKLSPLEREAFPPWRIKELYHLRWGIETSFRKLKYSLGLSQLHSKKARYVEQEIYARVILYNFCESVTPHVSTHQKKTKYAYQVNFTMAVHICKAFLQKSSPTISPHIETLLLRYLVPVKPGRKFPRTKKRKGFVSFAYRVS